MKTRIAVIIFVMIVLGASIPRTVTAQAPTVTPVYATATPTYNLVFFPTCTPVATSTSAFPTMQFPTVDLSTPDPNITPSPTLQFTLTPTATATSTPSPTPTQVSNDCQLRLLPGHGTEYTYGFIPQNWVVVTTVTSGGKALCTKPSYGHIICEVSGTFLDQDPGQDDNYSFTFNFVGVGGSNVYMRMLDIQDTCGWGMNFVYPTYHPQSGGDWTQAGTIEGARYNMLASPPLYHVLGGSVGQENSYDFSFQFRATCGGSNSGVSKYFKFELYNTEACAIAPTPTPTAPAPDTCLPYNSVVDTDAIKFTPPTIVSGFCTVILPSLSVDVPEVITDVTDAINISLPSNISTPGIEICFQYLVMTIVFLGFDVMIAISTIVTLISGITIVREFRG